MSVGPESPLRTIAELLERLGVPFMVVGSFASALYGAPRSTVDLDLVIDPDREQLGSLVAALDPERFYVDADTARDALARRTMFNVIDVATGWKLDLMIRKARPFSIEELRRRRRVEMLGIDVPMATPEDTIIAKLEWALQSASDRQLRDVAGVLRARAASLDGNYIEHWVAELGLAEVWQRARALV